MTTPPIPPQPPYMPAPQPEPRTRPAWLIPVIATTVVVGLTAATAGYLLASGNKTDNAAPGTSASPSSAITPDPPKPSPTPTPKVMSIALGLKNSPMRAPSRS